MKFKVVTLGCKVNSYESEVIINDLKKHNFEYVKDDECADVVIVNTCTVTQTSDQKSRQTIRNVRRNNPGAIIVAMGCYVQLNSIEASKLADVVIGTNNRLKVYELINSYLDTKKQINSIINPINIVSDVMNIKDYEDMKLTSVTTHTRGFVKIQDGCENFCSYCAIPYSRGKIRSRSPESVIEEINSLVNNNTHEVIIAGINTGTYGMDLGNINLASLIERIMKETSIYRLRLSSIELMEVTDELLDVIKRYESRIANHLHIPLQGGCDSILKRMKRKYTTAEYENKINKIKAMFPDIAITTDLLAGFVGETTDEFNQTKDFIKRIHFSQMHIFPYSRRKNTEADLLPNHLAPNIIKERAHELLQIASKMKYEYELKFKNKVLEVITEQIKGNYYTSHSSNYLEVLVPLDNEIKENMILKVMIESVDKNKIIGRRIK